MVIDQAAQTTFIDTTLEPNTAYEYRLTVTNAVGLEISSERHTTAGYSVAPVTLLSATSDPEEGTILLRWHRYRAARFTAYRVTRRVADSNRDSTLQVIADIDDTTFVDPRPREGEFYGYQVQVEAAGQVLTSDTRDARLSLPAVRDLVVDFDSHTASAALTWTPYTGPRFAAYRVWRREGQAVQPVGAEITDIARTSYVDAELPGNTEYAYHIVVLTQSREEVRGDEVAGSFHKLVATWPLPIATKGPYGRMVKVYAESGDRIAVLATSALGGARLMSFDPSGDAMGDEVLFTGGRLLFWKGASTALLPSGTRYFGGVFGEGKSRAILALDSSGRYVEEKRELFADAGLPPLAREEATVLGELALINRTATSSKWDNISLSVDGEAVMEEDFQSFRGNSEENWELSGGEVEIRAGRVRGGGIAAWRASTIVSGPTRDFEVELDVSVGEEATFQIGGEEYSRFTITLDKTQGVFLHWSHKPPPGSAAAARDTTFYDPFAIVEDLPYRFIVALSDGQLRVSVADKASWSAEFSPDVVEWSSMAPVGDRLAFTFDAHAYIMDESGYTEELGVFESPASDTRFWEVEGRRRGGVCLPDLGQVRLGGVRSASSWRKSLILKIGPRLGTDGGHLYWPVAFDGSPDGRIYVLDSGNSRVVSVDDNGTYITQWGRPGSDEGEFDFGPGVKPGGSICVDDEGYIYVADWYNKRVQKFAP